MYLNLYLPQYPKNPTEDNVLKYHQQVEQTLLLYTSEETHKSYYDAIKMFDFDDESALDIMIDGVSKSYEFARNLGINQLPIFNSGVYDTDDINLIVSKQNRMMNELDSLQNYFHPAVWCYDYYPVRASYKYTYINPVEIKGEMEESPYVGLTFYVWLETFKWISDKTKRPFWYYVLSMIFERRTIPDVSNPIVTVTRGLVSENYIRFSVFSALAYGTKGLRYWTYSLRNSREDETYINAPINLFNEKTELWGFVKTLNSEVKAYQSIFLNSESPTVYHTGDKLPYGTTRLPEPYGILQRLKNESEGLTVSFFKSNGKEYLMIVNHDILKKQEFEVEWECGIVPKNVCDGAVNVEKHYKHIDTFMNFSDDIESGYLSQKFELDPCGYVIFEYEGGNMPYMNPIPGEFPIMASTPTVEWNKNLDKTMFQDLQDNGCNIVDIPRWCWDPKAADELTQGTDVRLAISGLDWQNPTNCVNQVKSYSELSDGVVLWNLASDLARDPIAAKLNLLSDTYRAIRNLDTGKMQIFNIFPGWTQAESKKWLCDVEGMIRPCMWCYSPVEFRQRCDANGSPLPNTAPYNLPEVYFQLEDIHRMSELSERPFWYYVPVMSYYIIGKTYMHPVTEPIIRMSAFSALAYGAKGIRYWGYAICKSESNSTYFNAPIGLNGEKTEIWQWVKVVNTEIKSLKDIFLNSRGIKVYHTGDSLQMGTTPVPNFVGPFSSFNAEGAGVLVSVFKSDGVKYIMVVSHSVSETQDFTVTYRPQRAKLISVTDNKSVWPDSSRIIPPPEPPIPDPPVPDPNEYHLIRKFRLQPGGYAIFSFEEDETGPLFDD